MTWLPEGGLRNLRKTSQLTDAMGALSLAPGHSPPPPYSPPEAGYQDPFQAYTPSWNPVYAAVPSSTFPTAPPDNSAYALQTPPCPGWEGAACKYLPGPSAHHPSTAKGHSTHKTGSVETPIDLKLYKGSEMKWKKGGYERISSLCLLDDGSCLFISSQKLQRLSYQGKPIGLPFPCFAKNPIAVSASESSSNIVLVDDYQVSVYSKLGDHWKCRSFTSQRSIQTVAITEDGYTVCTAQIGLQNTVVMMSISGREKWSTPLPEGKYKAFICACKEFIIVSSTNDNSVTVRNRQGEVLHTFPVEFLQYPYGVTCDSAGCFIVADGANRSISRFTPQGHFIQTLVECQADPHSISLLQDCLLLVTEKNWAKDQYELTLYRLH